MRHNGVEGNAVSYSTVIKSYAQQGEARRSEWLQRIHPRRVFIARLAWLANAK